MPSYRHVGDLLRTLREDRGKTLRSAAKDLGVDPAHLSRLERGLKSTSGEFRNRAASYYAVGPEALDLAEGHIPDDVVEILKLHPELIEELRSRFDHGR